jgi:hypothetical protein
MKNSQVLLEVQYMRMDSGELCVHLMTFKQKKESSMHTEALNISICSENAALKKLTSHLMISARSGDREGLIVQQRTDTV